MSKCRWCGDESYRCEQIDGTCGWLLVAETDYNRMQQEIARAFIHPTATPDEIQKAIHRRLRRYSWENSIRGGILSEKYRGHLATALRRTCEEHIAIIISMTWKEPEKAPSPTVDVVPEIPHESSG